ncbi:hypothetical protein GGX14DRAFT_674486 [Mycena pura]|uniref:Uncharacterized protein n=1 Tax=Mycena pura TaxID=153505 RepID=A0AAD6Y497_9AGAR|nr:hypothetical protein GGX14DRAFT_674486 [Mycena pura]
MFLRDFRFIAFLMYPWSTRGFRVSKTDDPNPDPARPDPENPRVYPYPCPTLNIIQTALGHGGSIEKTRPLFRVSIGKLSSCTMDPTGPLLYFIQLTYLVFHSSAVTRRVRTNDLTWRRRSRAGSDGGQVSKPRARWWRPAAADNETEPLHAHGSVQRGARGVARLQRRRGVSPGGVGCRQAVAAARLSVRAMQGGGMGRRRRRVSKPTPRRAAAAADNETEPPHAHAHGSVRQGGGSGAGCRQAVTAARVSARARCRVARGNGAASVRGRWRGAGRCNVAAQQQASKASTCAAALPRWRQRRATAQRGALQGGGGSDRRKRARARSRERARAAARRGALQGGGTGALKGGGSSGQQRGAGRCAGALQRCCRAVAEAGVEIEPAHARGSVRGRRRGAGRCKAVGEACYGAAAAAVVESEPTHAPASVHGRWRSMGRCNAAVRARCSAAAAAGVESEPAHAPASVRGQRRGAGHCKASIKKKAWERSFGHLPQNQETTYYSFIMGPVRRRRLGRCADGMGWRADGAGRGADGMGRMQTTWGSVQIKCKNTYLLPPCIALHSVPDAHLERRHKKLELAELLDGTGWEYGVGCNLAVQGQYGRGWHYQTSTTTTIPYP